MVFFSLFILLSSSALPFKPDSIYGLTQPFLFSLARWQIISLLAEGKEKIEGLWITQIPEAEEIKLVKEYFSGDKRIRRERIEVILTKQVWRVLKEEGLSFPPLMFRLDASPHLLIISPRHKIELKKTIYLKQYLPLSKWEELEKGVEERLGVSALVTGLGGIATYPSLVSPSNVKCALQTIAHEWFHHYFSFYPLGRNYGKDYEMRTINETAADLAAEEVVSRILPLYGIKWERGLEDDPEFRKEMRKIRLTVEEYLGRGEIERAEKFMEESRRKLAEKGYYIRRLNQAYFAFYEAYADSPASISPIGEELKALRRRTASLGEFVRTVAKISSYEQLKRLLAP